MKFQIVKVESTYKPPLQCFQICFAVIYDKLYYLNNSNNIKFKGKKVSKEFEHNIKNIQFYLAFSLALWCFSSYRMNIFTSCRMK